VIGKLAAWLLIVAGVFNVVIWPRFFKAIVDDDRAWGGPEKWQDPQAFFWVHLVLIGTAMTLGAIVLVIGIRALRGQ
jgi:TRAP-type mannitol/chloroaromatic compound transport system permease small subunit